MYIIAVHRPPVKHISERFRILQGALLLPALFLAVVAVPTLALAIYSGEWPVKGWWPVIALASLVVLGGLWGAVAACTPPETRRRR